MKNVLKIFTVCLIYLITENSYGFEIERRRDVFTKQYGHLFVPLPYSLPGLGEGLLFIGNFGNIADTTTDLATILGVGDAEFIFGFLDEFFIVPDYVYLQYVKAQGFKYALTNYRSRGMNTEKNDFVYALGNYWEYDAPTFKLTLYDRMLELGLGRSKQKGRFEKFVAPDSDDLTKQGDTITEFDPALEVNFGEKLEFSARIDYTDDYRDPRKGVRNILYLDRQTASSSSEPSFDVITNDLQFYIPFLEKSTLVLNLTFSDANVRKEGETDLEVLKQQSNYYSCTSESCRETTLGNAKNTMNINKHGTSLYLGGPDRLRSYPQQRFQGAHTVYFATEFRWNFSAADGDEIDLFFMQDLVDEMQVAFFFEQGSVSETKSELGDTVKYSFGSGFRLLSGSGNLYRADFATGDEGPQVTVIIQYPWTYRI
tara:strand:+ start:272 stop:1552 length:1281 start_codon:yes stop_codon:yes gene_type:complete